MQIQSKADAVRVLEDHERRLNEMTSTLPYDTGNGRKTLPEEIRNKPGADRYKAALEVQAEPGSDLQKFHLMNDALVLLRAAVRDRNKVRKHPVYREWRRLSAEFMGKAAMDTADTSNWVPAEVLSGTLVDIVRDRSNVARLFRQFTMTGPTFKVPVVSADTTTYYWAESTAAPETTWNRITSSVLTDAQVSFSAKKFGIRTVLSNELLEDSEPDLIEYLTFELAQKLAEDVDNAVINGDATTATAGHFDTGRSLTSTSPLVAWDGLRYHINDQSWTTSCSGAITAVLVLSARSSMGAQYGGFRSVTEPDAVMITGPSAYSKLMQDTTGSLTWEKLGVPAPNIAGELNRVAGLPIVVNQQVPDGTLNASGVLDGATASVDTVAIIAHTPSWGLGTRREMTLRTSSEILMESDQTVAVITWRGDFKPLRAVASNEIAHGLIDTV